MAVLDGHRFRFGERTLSNLGRASSWRYVTASMCLMPVLVFGSYGESCSDWFSSEPCNELFDGELRGSFLRVRAFEFHFQFDKPSKK